MNAHDIFLEDPVALSVFILVQLCGTQFFDKVINAHKDISRRRTERANESSAIFKNFADCRRSRKYWRYKVKGDRSRKKH